MWDNSQSEQHCTFMLGLWNVKRTRQAGRPLYSILEMPRTGKQKSAQQIA